MPKQWTAETRFPTSYLDLYLIEDYPYEGESRKEVHECQQCGSVVSDKEAHSVWHDEYEVFMGVRR